MSKNKKKNAEKANGELWGYTDIFYWDHIPGLWEWKRKKLIGGGEKSVLYFYHFWLCKNVFVDWRSAWNLWFEFILGLWNHLINIMLVLLTEEQFL